MKPISNVSEGYSKTIAYSLKNNFNIYMNNIDRAEIIALSNSSLFSRSSLKEMLTNFLIN